MSKQITAKELAEIVTCLLVKPEIFGELESSESHMKFMEDIGRVVANHCGGDINGVDDNGEHDRALSIEGNVDVFLMRDQFYQPFLSVSPNQDLPSVSDNVWTLYDKDGWDDVPEVFAKAEIDSKRQEIQQLLINSSEFHATAVIRDNGEDKTNLIEVKIVSNENGVMLNFEGHSDYSSNDTAGYPIWIELLDGEVLARLYTDINSDEPTHKISLGGARDSARNPE